MTIDALTGIAPQHEETLTALTARLKRELVAYQNEALADRFAALVERVACAEKAQAPGRNGLAEAVARGYHKLLAAKDEYEAARLLTSDAFDADLADAFAQPSRVRFHLALTARGRKIAVGRWARPLLRALAALKVLRGGPFDPFRARPIRRLERALIAEYEDAMAHVLTRLTASNHDSACAIAALADTIRGFGMVKERTAALARKRQAALLATFAATGDTARAAE
jgi:indolepyruvate ferredoxin oxidoreductase